MHVLPVCWWLIVHCESRAQHEWLLRELLGLSACCTQATPDTKHCSAADPVRDKGQQAVYTPSLFQSITPPPGLPVTSSAGRCCTASNCAASCLRLLPAVALHADSSRCSQPSTRKARWYRDSTSTVTRAGWAQARGLRNCATCTYEQRGRQVPSHIISAKRAQQSGDRR